jgi:hypothetical protein
LYAVACNTSGASRTASGLGGLITTEYTYSMATTMYRYSIYERKKMQLHGIMYIHRLLIPNEVRKTENKK